MILAIDPGPEQSAWVLWDAEANRVMAFGIKSNLEVLAACYEHVNNAEGDIVIEMIASYGMAVGEEVFQTCVWIGRFQEAGSFEFGPVPTLVTRGEVKMHLCHSMKANDASIRQAILDRFGGKDKAIGKKKTPGPLYGLHSDLWSALAVALTYADRLAQQEQTA